MREILFHGKRTDNGEWVEGHFFTQVYHPETIEEEWYCFIKSIGSETWEKFRVNLASVGQYTGRKGENGVRIFEGHIISFKRTNALGWTTSRRGVVKYDEESTMFYVLASTGDAWGWYEISDVQVIGNIFDNPELMEGGT